MNVMVNTENPALAEIDQAVAKLNAAKGRWARTGVAERLQILADIRDATKTVAEGWALTASRKKQIPAGSPLAGEEWISGPYALMSGCNALMHTLSQIDGKRFLDHIPVRDAPGGRVAATTFPASIWDHLLLSGVKAEVWMRPGVTRANLASNTASAYDGPPESRKPTVALVLGAGNIAAIAPLDCLQELFVEHRVVMLKLNPVNDYLIDYLNVALKPLIDRDALRICRGGADIGGYLCNHDGIDKIHITGAEASHDAIVWGFGEEGRKNKANKTPRNTREITSELGGVSPTIVVPGPWSDSDLSFQAEQIATQKLHNSGFNCVACQMLVVPSDWDKTETLLQSVKDKIKAAPQRGLYYPGAEMRLADFKAHSADATVIDRESANCIITPFKDGDDAWFENSEVFAPAMTVHRMPGRDPAQYLRDAVKFSNERLRGTLGANILIHPATMRQIGKAQFDEIIADLKYGCIAVNCWTGLGFLLPQATWGAFPGHTLDNVQSGIGTVHNSFMFDRPERTVVSAPFAPFPRSTLSGRLTLLPRPPWFVTNRRQHKIGKLLVAFQHRPSWFKLPRIFVEALLG